MSTILNALYNVDHIRTARLMCFATGFLFILSGILQIVGIVIRAGQQALPTDRSEWENEYLRSLWKYRNSVVSIDLFTDAFIGLSYICFLYAIYVVRDLYKRERGYARQFMLFAFAGGMALNVLGFLQGLGVEIYCRSVTERLLNQTDPPTHALVAISVAYTIVRSSSWFLFGADALLFSVAFFVLYLITRASSSDDQHKLSMRHGYLSLGISILSIFLFLYEIIVSAADVWSSGAGAAFAIFFLVQNMILLPIWVIWLGIQLGNKSIPENKGEAKSLLGNQEKQ